MASTVYFLFTIVIFFTTANGASINTDINNIMNIIPEKCRELLLPENRGKRRNYCTEKLDLYPEEIRDEIEERIGPDLSLIGVPPQRIDTPPLTNDDCTKEDSKQNCCTKSGWVTPSSVILKGELSMVVQSKHLQQQYKEVECANQGTKCFNGLGILEQLGHFTECKTDYVYQKVYVYNVNRKSFKWAYINTPVSCSCVISRYPSMDYTMRDSPQKIEADDYFNMDDPTSRKF